MNKIKIAMALAVVFLSAAILTSCQQAQAERFSSSYQAILLANGSVYFGKLEGFGTQRPVLTNVYYVVSKSDPETKQVANVLVRRGKEWHAPDRMYLNPTQIVFVEPVGADSKVAQLITQDK